MNELEILKELVVYDPTNKKIRLGRSWDGGYIIIDDYDYDYFISAGIGGIGTGIEEDISFEIDFAKKYPDIKGLLFDGTVEGPQYVPKQYKFVKKNIDPISTVTTSNLKEYIESYNNVFIKMDIDGCEWDWILSFSDSFSKIKQLAFEMHGFFNNSIYPKANNDKILKSLQIINKTHYLVHAHPNNCCAYLTYLNNGTCEELYPDVLELTFIRKDCKISGLNVNNLPIPWLDFPNTNTRKDFNVNFWPFTSKYV